MNWFLWRVCIVVLTAGSMTALAEPTISWRQMSAENVAAAMIATNRQIDNFEGRFSLVHREHLDQSDLLELKQQTDAIAKSATTQMAKSVRRVYERTREEVQSAGAKIAQQQYQGIVDIAGRWAVAVEPVGSDGSVPKQVRLVCDGKREMEFDPVSSVALFSSVKRADAPGRSDAIRMFRMRQWMRWPNQIDSTEKVSIVEYTQHNGVDAVVLRQEPTSYSLNRCNVTHTVVPSKGFIAVRCEFRDNATNDPVTVIESQDVREIAPGIWRPMRLVDTRFKTRVGRQSARIDFEQIVEILSVKHLNQVLPDSVFSPSAPQDAAKLVDLETGSNEAFEIDMPRDDEYIGVRGIDSIVAVVNSNGHGTTTAPSERMTGKTSFHWLLTWIAVGLACLFVGFGLVLSRRRRK